jgi:hypothetical protein
MVASLVLGGLCWLGARCAAAPVAVQNARVDVILWFDTEDYLLLADDDACKRLATLLSERGIRATFKVVGEKARVLESRGRRDVIAALKKHDIAYHANLHSVHPTPTEYLADRGLLDGMNEFTRREGGGAADVRRVFSVRTLSCYGQPGSSWAPQAIAALSAIGVAPHGVPCYVDEGDHVGLDEKPFWYAGALNVYRLGKNCTRMDLHDPGALKPANQKVTAIAERLRGEGGGLVSIYYHPCEWVHQQFWDGVNFSRGANPPREQWRPPPQRPPAETDDAFRRFGAYIDHIRSIPGVRFVTASELPLLYPDRLRSRGVSRGDLDQLISSIGTAAVQQLDFQVIDGCAFSVADQFALLAEVVGGLIRGDHPRFPLVAQGLLGPDALPPAHEIPRVKWAAFRDSTLDVLDFIRSQRRIPAGVFIGSEAVAPASFLVGLASVYRTYATQGRLPAEGEIELGRQVKLLPERYVAEDSPGLFGGWIIHQEGFRAPKLMDLARLQAWTLKPALSGTAH